MKRYLLLISIAILGITSVNAQNINVRQEALFLTDKMAYELNLDGTQYGDVFEINYDFVASYQPLLVGMNYGNRNSINSYNRLLNLRDADMRYVLSSNQYRVYMGRDYFYRPLYRRSNTWSLGIYVHYTNRNYYYYNPPRSYNSYYGHSRRGSHRDYYYRDRYRNYSYSNNRTHRNNNSYYRRYERVRDNRKYDSRNNSYNRTHRGNSATPNYNNNRNHNRGNHSSSPGVNQNRNNNRGGSATSPKNDNYRKNNRGNRSNGTVAPSTNRSSNNSSSGRVNTRPTAPKKEVTPSQSKRGGRSTYNNNRPNSRSERVQQSRPSRSSSSERSSRSSRGGSGGSQRSSRTNSSGSTRSI